MFSGSVTWPNRRSFEAGNDGFGTGRDRLSDEQHAAVVVLM